MHKFGRSISCPVCGINVKDVRVSTIFKGERYLFCSQECNRSFNEDPESYHQLYFDEKKFNLVLPVLAIIAIIIFSFISGITNRERKNDDRDDRKNRQNKIKFLFVKIKLVITFMILIKTSVAFLRTKQISLAFKNCTDSYIFDVYSANWTTNRSAKFVHNILLCKKGLSPNLIKL